MPVVSAARPLQSIWWLEEMVFDRDRICDNETRLHVHLGKRRFQKLWISGNLEIWKIGRQGET